MIYRRTLRRTQHLYDCTSVARTPNQGLYGSPTSHIAGLGVPGIVLCLLLGNCDSSQHAPARMIEFIKIPNADTGGPSKLDLIKGRVNGAKPGQRIVIYASSGGVWWGQPLVNKPYTEIQADSQWSSSIHLGMEYAALLVEPGYEPLPTIKVLPEQGGKVVAIAIAKGKGLPPPVAKTLHFSGYDWDVRQEPSRRGGKVNP